ncbi:fumarylacetoacetate hydrolase family protein [Caldilinea sp.]|uniref:fumarylacetoacetate hydrolase family protein n=1 Tax=Caldilinea sp. TaxID=2293560 RepID=UPI0026366C3C|nr:fumarylacetoacetate hydrolase family protein [uncultured Caldilinea sp.]
MRVYKNGVLIGAGPTTSFFVNRGGRIGAWHHQPPARASTTSAAATRPPAGSAAPPPKKLGSPSITGSTFPPSNSIIHNRTQCRRIHYLEANMTQLFLVRFHDPALGSRVGVQIGATVHDVTEEVGSVAMWLRASAGRVDAAIADLRQAVHSSPYTVPTDALNHEPAPDRLHWLPPVDAQDVWAAGVTYERSRIARQEEAKDGGDVYARVYVAERPELFFKARGPWVVGPYDRVGIRHDATWNVPEPELVLIINPALEIVGFTIGSDMSSRDIEGENPLYLPQAKIYTRSCALGPAIALGKVDNVWPAKRIAMQIVRNGAVVFSGETHTGKIRRRPDELVAYLGRALKFPDGVALMSGTGIVPEDTFTLTAGDEVQITIEDVGTLRNVVAVV